MATRREVSTGDTMQCLGLMLVCWACSAISPKGVSRLWRRYLTARATAVGRGRRFSHAPGQEAFKTAFAVSMNARSFGARDARRG